MIIDNYTDIHSHLLFGLDDGPRDLEESIILLKMARDEGIRTQFLTPHYGPESGYTPDAQKIRENFEILKARARIEVPEMTLLLGSELYCAPNQVIGRVERGEALSMANTSYLLLEFNEWGPYRQTAEHITKSMLFLRHTNWRLILAHAERYRDFKGKQSLYRDLVSGGVYLQINAYDLMDQPDDWVRENTRWLVQNRLAHFIGTDAHRLKKRTPVMRSGVDYLYQHCDEAYADALVKGNADKLIAGERVPLSY
ncbi:MAG: hypothetical protein QM308_01615 [Bacillota bacterium]|nr:hypothetical protein [Bacillota bacterium]